MQNEPADLAKSSNSLQTAHRSVGLKLAVFACGLILPVSAQSAEFIVDPAPHAPNQTFAQDSLSPDWFNSSGTVVEHTAWTAAPTKYFGSDDQTQYTLRTRSASRDQEVETWGRQCRAYLRLTDGGKCILFYVNGDAPTVHFRIYILTGEIASDPSAARSFRVIENLNLAAMLPGYDSANTDGDYFTFGVEGFDIYAKYNGQEFFRAREYRHMEEGRIALRSQAPANPYGLRKTTARLFDPKPLFSNYTNNELDLRDFGWRTSACVGSIDAGTNQLRLQAPPNPPFQKGDYLIVEPGGEAGQGLRGTLGVGGSWPDLSYANAALRDADPSQPTNTYAWVEADGTVRQWDGSAWLDVSTFVNYETTPPVTNSTYYAAKAIPMALRAYVQAVSLDGLTLTLSRAAKASSTNANVYFDNAFVFDKLGRTAHFDGEMNYPFEQKGTDNGADFRDITPTNLTLRVPAGDYAVGEQLVVNNHAGWKIIGAGAELTSIFSPRGTPSASLVFLFCPDAQVRDLRIHGNARNDGFGVKWPTLFLPGGNVTQTSYPRDALPEGFVFGQGSDRSRAVNVRATDVFGRAFGASFANDVWVENCHVTLTEGQRAYIGWPFAWNDCQGGGATNCSFWSSELVHGWSIFRSTGVQYLNCISTNGIMAPNGSGNFRVKDFTFIITPGSQPFDRSFNWEPIVIVNNNIKDPTFLSQGGLLENVRIFQLGYINASNDTLYGINISADTPNITVRGGVFSSPDYAQPSTFDGAVGVNSTGLNTLVDGFRVIGKARGQTGIQAANIGIYDGVVRNSFADSIYVTGPARLENCLPNSNRTPIIGRLKENVILQGQDIGVPGNPLEAGTTTVSGNGEIEVQAGGSFSVTGFSDFLHFSHFALRGDFDIRAQVTRLDAITGLSQAGLMARYGTNSSSPTILLSQSAPGVPSGGGPAGNWSLLGARAEPGGYLDFHLADVYVGLPQTNVFANVWLRLVRRGNTFTAYRGSAGAFLEPIAEYTMPAPVPEDLLVGLVTSSGSNDPGQTTIAQYRDLQVIDRSPITNRTVLQGTVVNLNVPVIEHDQGQSVSFALEGNPQGATIHLTTGEFTWDTSGVPAPTTNEFVVVATDNGTPPLSDTNHIRILVAQPNVPPVITPPQPVVVQENTTAQVLVVAQDANHPKQTLIFTLGSNAPAGASIGSTSGLFSWAPNEAQGPGDYSIEVIATDNGVPALSATNTLLVVVIELNAAPVLALPFNTIINELDTIIANATAIDADLPTNALKFALVSGPGGLTVSSNGDISWMPAEDQGPSTNTVTISVTDTNPLAVNATSLSVTSNFQVVVSEVNQAPVLATMSNRTVNPGQTISFTATATDADLPTNTMTFSLVSPPAGADINGASGLFNWRPAVALADTTNTVQVRVQDNAVPNLSATNSFSVVVNSLGAPVVLTPVSLIGGQFNLQVSGPTGPDYVLLASTNLTQWSDLQTNLAPTPPFQFNDATVGAFSNRVYRVRLQP